SVNYSARTDALSVSFGTNVTNVETITGNDVAGSMLSNGTLWTLTGSHAGNVTDAASGCANCVGSGGAVFTAFPNVAGTSGSDTLIGANVANTWTITSANTGTVTNLTGFAGIENLVGNANAGSYSSTNSLTFSSIENLVGAGTAAGADTLIGPNTANAWNITSADAGSITGMLTSFSGMENLSGGTGNDGFAFANNATISG